MIQNRAFLFTLYFIFLALLLCFIIIGMGLLLGKRVQSSSDTAAIVENNQTTIVIDAGHGGEDAGAVAPDGTLEKELNLEIATLLYAICKLNGNEVKMTRTTDTLLYDYYDDLQDYSGQKKIYDLKNRLKIANEYQNPIYIGIHMNKFSVSKYSGLQVYYSANTNQSYYLANEIKCLNKLYLQKNNTRDVKMANSSIYVLDKASCPAVLIECGFLSNENELNNLKSRDYQLSLALVMFASITKFT